ncbi:hypothetical protein ABGN05_24975 [Aquibium sp. LZ166]|uniref:Uncharacterized protein n=1 Tax=Aquibium pacificus TaxID=3153579 RepID=A0ABV3SQ17_9HYPH
MHKKPATATTRKHRHLDPSKPIYMTLTGSLIPILNPEQLEALRELEMPLVPRIPLTMHSAMRH